MRLSISTWPWSWIEVKDAQPLCQRCMYLTPSSTQSWLKMDIRLCRGERERSTCLVVATLPGQVIVEIIVSDHMTWFSFRSIWERIGAWAASTSGRRLVRTMTVFTGLDRIHWVRCACTWSRNHLIKRSGPLTSLAGYFDAMLIFRLRRMATTAGCLHWHLLNIWAAMLILHSRRNTWDTFVVRLSTRLPLASCLYLNDFALFRLMIYDYLLRSLFLLLNTEVLLSIVQVRTTNWMNTFKVTWCHIIYQAKQWFKL